MNHIGKTIKDLRRKNDLTQEKLADQLGVSYQTVSKWETGITSPDLSLIVPLARLFQVTTDELFEFNENADMLRKKHLDEAYRETWKSGDLKKRFEVSKQAVKEFPNDMEWHDRLAWAQAMGSFAYEDDTLYSREQEEAIRRFAFVVENASDDKIRASSIQGIVQYLSIRGRKDEAMLELLNLVGNGSDTACDAQEGILHIMIPDANYLYYHVFLADIYRKRTIFRLKEADYDNALNMLKQAFYHAREYDLFMDGKVSAKSLPFFDKMQWNVEEICRTGTTTQVEDMLKFLDEPLFDPIREWDDIKALIKEFCRS